MDEQYDGTKISGQYRNGNKIAGAIDTISFAIQAKQKFGGQANIRVLSASWGGMDAFQALLDAILRAGSNGMLFVAAAGNSSGNNDLVPSHPASYSAPNIVSVAATDRADNLSYFSNYGARLVHLGAPGSGILSTVRFGQYAYFSGTSMATPHVSGAAMLALSACNLDTAQLKSLLLSSVDQIASLAGRVSSGGRLNVDRTVRGCLATPTSAVPVSLVAHHSGKCLDVLNAGIRKIGSDSSSGLVTEMHNNASG